MKCDKVALVENFRMWVNKLTECELLGAMEFPLGETEASLLEEIVQQLAPPPTPIHPKAVGYKVCSEMRITDGRDDLERSRRDRIQRPRLLQLVDLDGSRQQVSQKRNRGRGYFVVSRKFVLPDGERLSLGSTNEQREADELLVLSTVLIRSPDGATPFVRFRPVKWKNYSILRLLKVASRGNFLLHDLSRCVWTEEHSLNFSGWFDPTQRWFSLSMYLASRFETSLWSFYMHKELRMHDFRPERTAWPCFKLPVKDLEMALFAALQRSIADGLFASIQNDYLHRLRDSLLFVLLEHESTLSRWKALVRGRILVDATLLLLVPELLTGHIIDMGSPMDAFRRLLCLNLQQALVSKAESALLLELELENAPTERGKPLKSKKKKNLNNRRGQRMKECVPNTNLMDDITQDTCDGYNADQISDDGCKTETPQVGRDDHKRNQNAIAVLTLLDEILEKSFLEVGLHPDNLESNENDGYGVSLGPDNLEDEKDDSCSIENSLAPSNNDLSGRSHHCGGKIGTEGNEWCESSHTHLLGLFSSDAASNTLREDQPVVSSTAASIDSMSDNAESDEGAVVSRICEATTDREADADNDDADEISASLDHNQPPSNSSPVHLPMINHDGCARTDQPSLALCRSFSSITATSLPGSKVSSVLARKDYCAAAFEPTALLKTLAPSHRDVPVMRQTSRDDHDIHRRRKPTDVLSSYRNTLLRNTISKDDHDIRQTQYASRISDPSPRSSSGKSSSKCPATPSRIVPDSFRLLHQLHGDFSLSKFDLSARSETALDGCINPPWLESRRSQSVDDADNNTMTKDGSTTITSALSQRESEEVLALREERNSYRDVCLTLGAEVAKLKNLLAVARGASPALQGGCTPCSPYLHRGGFSWDPESLGPAFPAAPRARTLAAMSDAGYRGEHESLASEDDTCGRTKLDTRNASSVATIADSDVSIDHVSNHVTIQLPGCIPVSREIHDPVSLNGMHSRLTQEINQFVDVMSIHLRKQHGKRQTAVERMARLVNTLWPRAQVKLYGSHVTGLCLPSSDLDFVICLPAVHKKTLAVAPGVLEGRNAINESSQKLLFRKLKGESWIDPRSIKLIERTAVPVIKVCTKDVKAKTLQLDITFDAPGHHGLEALHMVSQILEELPMIRPLVLVLKQFLLNRCLLTAYTGGLSSYCLFLMVARYLQEQPSPWGDGGALLIGFLDFFGNHFDPRTTGISVLRSEYFARPSYSASRISVNSNSSSPVWKNLQFSASSSQGNGFTSFHRRNSFSDRASVDVLRSSSPAARPPRFLAGYQQQQFNVLHSGMPEIPVEHRIPYTFDPLWVEDPLSEGNNVGRNAFRFLQVQRAFSDAHRALVAALEWDMQSTGELQENELSLLQSLLQSEDVVLDL